MHDPLVVAFEIPRPWPKLRQPGRERDVLGRFRWPSLITVWHREPRGHDSGEICRHYVRTPVGDGQWTTKHLHGWKFHVHHWHLQIHPLQTLRRWALTRCAWCAGRQRKTDQVNISHQWDGPRGRWWQGEPGLFHHDCSAIATAHRSCVCVQPGTLKHGNYGECSRCGRFLEFGRKPLTTDTRRLLQTIPTGRRDPEVYAEVKRRWATTREDVSTP